MRLALFHSGNNKGLSINDSPPGPGAEQRSFSKHCLAGDIRQNTRPDGRPYSQVLSLNVLIRTHTTCLLST